MEYFDVLTEKGELTGQSASRDEVHAKGLWHRSVHVWILNSAEELLIQKRSKIKESYPSMCDISAAGHVSAGESVEEAVMKESSEELGIEVDVKDLIKIGEVIQCAVLKNGTYINNEFNDIFLMRRDIDISTLTLQESEVEEVKLIFWRDFQKMVLEKDPTLVDHSEEYALLFDFLEKNFK